MRSLIPLHLPALNGQRQLPLRIHIATLFIALILLLGSAVIGNNYTETTRLMLQVADDRFERIADRTRQQLYSLFAPVGVTVDQLAWQPLAFAGSLEERLNSLHYLREALEQSDQVSALFIGYDNGDFFLLRPLPADSPLRSAFNPPEAAHYLVQSIERDAAGATTGTFPLDDLLSDATRIRNQSVLIALGLVLLALPATWLLSNRIARHLQNLVGEATRIRHLEFQKPIVVRSIITEVNQLADAMAQMKSTIRRFLDISGALAAEQNFEQLLDRVLAETLALAEADAGLLWLVSDDERELQPAAARRRRTDEPVALTSFAALALTGPAPHPLVQAAQAAIPQVQPLAADGPLADYLAPLIERPGPLIIVPLCNRQQELVGVLALLAAGQGVSPELLAFIAALSGTAAVSIENQRLLHARKNLFEAFIRLLADAIDAKSPYTGGHCARVPELTQLLAEAACATRGGPFRNFSLSAAEWEELHVTRSTNTSSRLSSCCRGCRSRNRCGESRRSLAATMKKWMAVVIRNGCTVTR